MDPSTFVGRAPEQVVEFLEAEVQPLLDRYGFAKKSENQSRCEWLALKPSDLQVCWPAGGQCQLGCVNCLCQEEKLS